MSPRIRIALVLAAIFVAFTTSRAQQLNGIADAAALRAAIEQRLTVAPRGFERLTSPAQAGVAVRDVRVETNRQRSRITIDLSQRALTWDPGGDTELLLDEVLRSIATLTPEGAEFRFLVDGLPLEQFARQPAPPRVLLRNAQPRRPVVISAGHGVYWNEYWSLWMLQRSYYWGLAEDLVNLDFARYTLDELSWWGIEARAARQPDVDAAPGVSGYAAWQEGAKYFIRGLGAPPEVSDFGANEYNRDINSRPFYANWVDAAALVSIHNNGGYGTGTETWYDETNGFADESFRLAQIVHDRVVATIRAEYDPNWIDRGLKSCNACKGETRLATRPSILIEIAFMDTEWPDNAALRDERFKRLVARAIREGIQQWTGVTTPARAPG